VHSLEITTDASADLVADLFGPETTLGAEATLGADVTASFNGVRRDRGGISEIVMLVLTFPVGVATNVVSDVIKDRLRMRRAATAVRRIELVTEAESASGSHRTARRQTMTIDLERPGD
jgi:hypothetical protein